MWKVVYSSDMVLTEHLHQGATMSLGGIVNPGIPHPSAFLLLLVSLSSLLPQTKSCPYHFQASSILLTHDRTHTRKTAGLGHTDPPSSHTQNTSSPFRVCLHGITLLMSVQAGWTPAQSKPSSITPLPPSPGSRQCRSRRELIPGCRRGSPAEAAGAAQCSAKDRQGN